MKKRAAQLTLFDKKAFAVPIEGVCIITKQAPKINQKKDNTFKEINQMGKYFNKEATIHAVAKKVVKVVKGLAKATRDIPTNVRKTLVADVSTLAARSKAAKDIVKGLILPGAGAVGVVGVARSKKERS